METPAPAIPRSLFAFSVFYGGMVCIAGVLGNKLVSLGPISEIGPLVGLGPLAVEAGIFAFLMLIVTSSAIAELHGREWANRLVRFGFVPLICAMGLLVFVDWLPAAPEMNARPEAIQATHIIFFQSMRLMVAGLIAYGTSQTLNVMIFSALKGREGSRMLWFRAATASVISQIVDTLLFITISFYGVFPIRDVLVGQMATKVVLSAVLVPLLIYLLVALGRRLDRA